MKPRLDDLTVFVISSGEEVEGECIKSLQSQNCEFKIKQIKGVTPMSKAFQSMPDNCKTAYFVQVDADMILDSDAIQTLYNLVKKSPFWIYRVSASLFEEGFGVGGAVKCWKSGIFRFFHFDNARTVDRCFHKKLRRFGLTYRHTSQVVGVHRPRHSNFSLYLKTKSDVEKWRFLKRSSDLYAVELIDKILHAKNISHHMILGILMGGMTGRERLIRSKDFTLESELFTNIISTLGQDFELSKSRISKFDSNVIRTIFLSAYDDFRGKSSDKRELLASVVISIFSRKEDLKHCTPSDFIRVIDQ